MQETGREFGGFHDRAGGDDRVGAAALNIRCEHVCIGLLPQFTEVLRGRNVTEGGLWEVGLEAERATGEAEPESDSSGELPASFLETTISDLQAGCTHMPSSLTRA